MNTNRTRTIAFMAAATLAVMAPAQNFHWENPLGGSWTTGTNWSQTTSPGANTDFVFVDLVTGNPYSITANNLDLNLAQYSQSSEDAIVNFSSTNLTFETGTTGFSMTSGIVNLNDTLLTSTSAVVGVGLNGRMNARGNSTISGALAVLGGGTFAVQGTNTTGSANVSVGNILNGSGSLILMESTGSAWGTTFSSTNLTNHSVFRSAIGTGGNRNFSGNFYNFSNMDILQNLTFLAGSTLDLNVGSSITGTGALRLSQSDLTVKGGTVDATTYVADGHITYDANSFSSTIEARGNTTVSGEILGTLRVLGANTDGSANLTTQPSTINNGTISLDTIGTAWASHLILTGGLTNNGILEVKTGTGGSKGIQDGTLTNTGTLRGLEEILALENVELLMNGGTTEGTVQLRNSLLNFGASSTATGAITLIDNNDLQGTIASGATVNIVGQNVGGGNSTTLIGNVQNKGIINVFSTGTSWNATLTGNLENDATGTLNFLAGTGGTKFFNGNLTNEGLLTNTAETRFNSGTFINRGTLQNDGTLELLDATILDGGSIIGTGETYVRTGNLSMTNSGETGTIQTRGSSVTIDTDISSGMTVLIRGANIGGSATLLATQPTMTNYGVMELESESTSWSSTFNGNLVNENIVNLNAGTGGTRTLNGELTNNGLITISQFTNISGSGADHVNNGTIELNDVQLNLTGNSFINNGTFKGTGIVDDNSSVDFTNAGILAAGHSAGTLDFTQTLINTNTSTWQIELGGIGIGESDLITSRFLQLDGALEVSIINGATFNTGDTIRIATTNNSSGVTGAFSSFNAGSNWDIVYGANYVDLVATDAVPEPATMAILGLGTLIALRKKRKA